MIIACCPAWPYGVIMDKTYVHYCVNLAYLFCYIPSIHIQYSNIKVGKIVLVIKSLDVSFSGKVFSRSVGLSTAVKQVLAEKSSNFELKSQFSGLDLFKIVLDQLKKGTNTFNFL